MSERSLSAALATAVTDLVVYPVLFLEGEFSTGWGRWWSGVGPFSWDGETWVGLGGLLSVSPISETTDTKAQGFSIDLSGQDPANIAIALSACRQGKVGRIWLGALTAAGVLVGVSVFSSLSDEPKQPAKVRPSKMAMRRAMCARVNGTADRAAEDRGQ